jgi:hypothetical protein
VGVHMRFEVCRWTSSLHGLQIGPRGMLTTHYCMATRGPWLGCGCGVVRLLTPTTASNWPCTRHARGLLCLMLVLACCSCCVVPLQLSQELALNRLLGLQQPAGAGALGLQQLSGAAQQARAQQQQQPAGGFVAAGAKGCCCCMRLRGLAT